MGTDRRDHPADIDGPRVGDARPLTPPRIDRLSDAGRSTTAAGGVTILGRGVVR